MRNVVTSASTYLLAGYKQQVRFVTEPNSLRYMYTGWMGVCLQHEVHLVMHFQA